MTCLAVPLHRDTIHINSTCFTYEKRYKQPDTPEPARIFVQNYNGILPEVLPTEGNPSIFRQTVGYRRIYTCSLQRDPGKCPCPIGNIHAAQMHKHDSGNADKHSEKNDQFKTCFVLSLVPVPDHGGSLRSTRRFGRPFRIWSSSPPGPVKLMRIFRLPSLN